MTDTADQGAAVALLFVNDMTCREAAHWYLDQGLRPIPWVVRDGRKVVPFGGFHYETYTVDHETIDRWEPHWQVGLALSEAGGVFAVDVDSYDELARWQQEYGGGMVGLSQTWRQTSGRDDGGEHRLYLAGGDWPRHGKFSTDYQRLEIISNGLLAVSPSVHPSGRQYRWRPGPASYVPTPPLLQEFLDQRQVARATNGVGSARVGAHAQNGRLDVGKLLVERMGAGHDTTLSRLVFQLVRDGRADAEIALIWRTVANLNQDPADPFVEADFERHLNSARAKLADHHPIVVEDWQWETVRRWQEQSAAGLPYQSGAVKEPAVSTEEEKLKLREQWRLEARDTYQRERAAEMFSVPAPEQEVTLAEGLTLPLPERRYLLDGLIGQRHNGTITAGYKTGKTTMIGNIIRSLVDGIPFLGVYNPAALQGNVGFWNLEMDAEDLYEYWRPMGILNGDHVIIEHLRGDRVPFMGSLPAREWTIDWLKRNEIKVWIVDSWTRLCNGWHGVAEKDNAGYAALTSEIDQIKAETGVEVFLATCHMPRAEQAEGQERARGGAALDDWVDTRWVLTKQDDERFLYCEGRGVRLDETALVFDEETSLLTIGAGNRAAAREVDVPREVLEFVRLHPDSDTDTIKRGIPIGAQRVTNAIHQLVAQGLILRERRGRSWHHSMIALPGS